MPRNASHRARTLPSALAATAIVIGALTLGACGGGGSGSDGNAAAEGRSTSSSTTTSKTGSTTGDAPAVAIEDFAFSPGELHVAVGTKVTFTNKDGFDHTVTAKDKSFDSDHLAKDATFEHTFDAPGTYPYLCSIHNSMTGSVVVS
jgi:plastocyanin